MNLVCVSFSATTFLCAGPRMLNREDVLKVARSSLLFKGLFGKKSRCPPPSAYFCTELPKTRFSKHRREKEKRNAYRCSLQDANCHFSKHTRSEEQHCSVALQSKKTQLEQKNECLNHFLFKQYSSHLLLSILFLSAFLNTFFK